jgi:putative transposase
LKFLEIGTDEDHVHFFVQAVLVYSVKKAVQMIKSLTVGKYEDEVITGNYVNGQGGTYQKSHSDYQWTLF